jgi:hypothetical protein
MIVFETIIGLVVIPSAGVVFADRARIAAALRRSKAARGTCFCI